MKKVLIGIVVLISVIVALFLAMGLSVSNLKSNVDVGVGIAAKLGCTSRYLSGFTSEQITEDLRSYSEAISAFSLHFDDVTKVTTASILGFNEVSATYRPGLGCSLDIGDTSALDAIKIAPNTSKTTLPANVEHDVQTVLDTVMSDDDEVGLNTRALTVVSNGMVIAEKYADGMSSDTPHLGWSMGKSVTSLLIGHLVMNGKLDPAQTQLFPQWQDERADIPLENLLTMTSGLFFDETYAPGSDATHMLFSVHDGSAIPRDQPQAHPPGTHFAYSSGTTALLSRLVVAELGGVTSTYPYLYHQIFRPMGIHTLRLEPDPSGVFVGSSYVYGTAYDWARLGQIYLNGGELDGVRVVTEEWIKASQQVNKSTNDPAYGYQVWLNHSIKGGAEHLRWPSLPKDTYAMTGNRGQYVMMIPSMKLILVRLGWSGQRYPLDDRFGRVVSSL